MYPDLDLKKARQKTDEFRRLVSLGIDPRSEKRDKHAKQQMTVDRMVTEFINQYAKPKNTSWKQAESNLRLYLVSALGRQSIHDVKRPDIHSILDELVGCGKHTAANRALAHIRKFFGWLVERGYLDHSPADHIKPRHQEQERERVLTDAEIKSDLECLRGDERSVQGMDQVITTMRSEAPRNCLSAPHTDRRQMLAPFR
jgi:site-specific recombinase XerD